MTNTEWTIHGREFANCNCAYGCPCQFNALPTHGNCSFHRPTRRAVHQPDDRRRIPGCHRARQRLRIHPCRNGPRLVEDGGADQARPRRFLRAVRRTASLSGRYHPLMQAVDAGLAALMRRDRLAVAAALIIVTLLAWAYVLLL